MSEEPVYKVLLLGDSTVGKTCFLKNGKKIKLQIWDTAGQDRFRAITRNYYKGANGVILVYDVTNVQSYDNVKMWVAQIREKAPKNVVILIAGNKIDKEERRQVQKEEGQKIADEFGFPFFETSAKEGININETFEEIVEKIDLVYTADGKNIKIRKKNKKFGGNRNGCC